MMDRKRIGEFSVYATLNSAIRSLMVENELYCRWERTLYKRNEPSINWAKTYYYAVIFMRNSHFVDGLFFFYVISSDASFVCG